MIRTVITYGCWMLASATSAGQTATLQMRFVLDGAPPPVKQIDVAPAFAPAVGPIIDERLLVDPKSRGIKNILVYVYTGREGTKIEVPPRQNQRRRLTMANARFDPHILIAQAGDTLELVERGPNQHNPNLSFFANTPRGILIPPGRPNLIPLLKPEPAPIPVDCNIHPWMRAYVVVLDHPFAAVSDSDGNLKIAELPTDTSLTFRVFHEAGRIDHVKISGVDTDWRRSRFDIELAAGVNDLGDILIPPESLTY